MPPKLLTGVIVVAAMFVAGAVAWAGVTNVTSAARTSGTIAPKGAIYAVQHLEGGIVRDVLVRDGDHVAPGDLLIRLDNVASGADLYQLGSRRMMLSAQSLRLRAEIEGHPESFAEFRNRDETLIADQLRLLSAARQSYDDE